MKDKQVAATEPKKKEYDQYEIEHAHRTLMEAHKIRKNEGLMVKVKEYSQGAQEMLSDLGSSPKKKKPQSIKELRQRHSTMMLKD